MFARETIVPPWIRSHICLPREGVGSICILRRFRRLEEELISFQKESISKHPMDPRDALLG